LLITYELEEKRSTAYGRILASAAQAPQPPPQEREAEALIEEVLTALHRRHGSKIDILWRDSIPQSQFAQACEMWIAYFRAIIGRRPAEAGRILRHLYDDSTDDEQDAPETTAAAADIPKTDVLPRPPQKK